MPVPCHAKLSQSLAIAGLISMLAIPADAGREAQPAGGLIWIIRHSTAPANIALVGSAGGISDVAHGQFTVVARGGVDGYPLAGARVAVDFSNAADLSLCPDQLDPDVTVFPGPNVQKVTDSEGRATFTILGGSNGAGNASSLLEYGRIYVNGTLVKSPTVAAYDLDGGSGVGANDLSAWLGDFGTGEPFGRSDFDASGTVGANDLSVWLSVYGAGLSATSCALH